MHRLLAAVAVTVVGGIGAGCGGSAGEGASGDEFSVQANTTVTVAKSLTKPKLVAHVNSLCRRKWPFILHAFREYQEDLRTIAEPQLNRKQRFVKATRLAYFASIDFHIFDHALDLGAPPGEKQTVEEVFGTMQEGVERGQRQRAVTSQAQVEALFTDYNRVASRYGLDQCLVTGQHLPHGDARNR